MSNKEDNRTSYIYLEKMFPNKLIKWDEIYMLARNLTQNTYLRCFRYKTFKNILYLNNKLSHLN